MVGRGTDLVGSTAYVYGAINKRCGRWYVGSTKTNVACRRHQHYATALNPRTAAHTFYTALRETEESDWSWHTFQTLEDCTWKELRAAEHDHAVRMRALDGRGYNTVPSKGMTAAERKEALKLKWQSIAQDPAKKAVVYAKQRVRRYANHDKVVEAQRQCRARIRQDPVRRARYNEAKKLRERRRRAMLTPEQREAERVKVLEAVARFRARKKAREQAATAVS